jgi:hypothetical protein
MVSLGNTSLLAADGSEAIHSLAKILLDFTHVPSAPQKAALQHILDDKATTAAERVLAQALINVEHLASPEDKPKLEALIRDESVPPAVKTLATILRNLTHTPTEMNKKKLRQLLRKGNRFQGLTPSAAASSRMRCDSALECAPKPNTPPLAAATALQSSMMRLIRRVRVSMSRRASRSRSASVATR